jgi:hypothetical protein
MIDVMSETAIATSRPPPPATVPPAGGWPDPETELLAWCGRAVLDPVAASRISRRLREGIDSQRLLALAERHRLLPLLYFNLKRVGVPAGSLAVWSALEVRFRQNATRILAVTANLLAVLDAFEERAIPVVPFKGPVLAQRLYGSLALRPSGDLDILIRREDYPAARALLLERGYQPRHVLPPGGEAFLLRSRYAEVFDRPDSATVELHWGFTNGDIGLSLALDELLPRTESLAIGGRTVSVLADDDLLLVLCVHGAKHCWDRLEWICGVGDLIRSSRSLAWAPLLERARERGVGRMLLLGAALAHELVEAPLPPYVLAEIRRDHRVPAAVAGVRRILAGDPIDTEREGSLASDIFRFHLRERLRDRLRFVLYRLTTPSTPEEWTVLTVGDRVVPVHALLRPFHLLARLLPALRGRRVPREPLP